MVETVTKEELEQVRSSGGRICFTLCTDEDLKKFTAVKKHLEERKSNRNQCRRGSRTP